MKRSHVVTIVLATLLIPSLCIADPPRPGPYVAGFIGATIPQNSTVTGFDFLSGVPFSDRVEFDTGINVGAAVGYDFGYLRLEGELSYKYSDIKSVTEQLPRPIEFFNVSGNLGVFAGLVNLFIDLHNTTPFTPYVGGGAGFATLSLSDTFGTNPATFISGPLYVSDTETTFAYQVGGGLGIALNRLVTLDLAYRYFGTSNVTFGSGSPVTATMKFESHNATAGVRVKFY